MRTHCPVTHDLNRYELEQEPAGVRELLIEEATAKHAAALLNTGCVVFDRTTYRCDVATIENDVEPLLCDVISAHDFDVKSAQVLFALARQFHAEQCAPEQQAADMELLSQFAQIGKQVIEMAAKQIAEKEWERTHAN
jgi:hypothetical protein